MRRAGRCSGRRSATRLLIAAATVVAAWCIAIGAAGGAVVVSRSIAGVHSGDSKSSVIKKLGKPFVMDHVQRTIFMAFKHPVIQITLKGSPARVSYVITTDHKQRIRRGIHPGSGRSAVRAAYPKVVCGVAPVPGEGFPPVNYCDLEVGADGNASRATRFALPKKRHLKSITICADCEFIVQQAPAGGWLEMRRASA